MAERKGPDGGNYGLTRIEAVWPTTQHRETMFWVFLVSLAALAGIIAWGR
jgi:hypothetical protein